MTTSRLLKPIHWGAVFIVSSKDEILPHWRPARLHLSEDRLDFNVMVQFCLLPLRLQDRPDFARVDVHLM